jgi:hypothetical protein
MTTLITNHTFSSLVLRPNVAAADLAPPSEGIPLGDPFDEAALKALGDRMAAQNGYTSRHAWELYDTTGSTGLDHPELDTDGLPVHHRVRDRARAGGDLDPYL